MSSVPCDCSWVQHHYFGYEDCVHCGNRRNIDYTSQGFRTVPVSTISGNSLNRWINHSASPKKSSDTEKPERDHSADVITLVDRYVMDQEVITSLGSLWDSFIKKTKIAPKQNRRKACIAVIILSNHSLWKGHDGIRHIRAEISTRDLYKALKYIRRMGSVGTVDLTEYAPDIDSFKLEELDWSSCFDEELWDRALVYDQHLRRLNLRAYSQDQGEGKVKWSHYSDTVVRGIAILMAFAKMNWKPGMAPGGKYLKDITKRVLLVLGLSPTATRTVRSPLVRLFSYIPILGDESQVEELLDFYYAREKEREAETVRESDKPVDLMSSIRTSFVCGESEVYMDVGVDCFEDFVRCIARSDENSDYPLEIPFKWNLRQKRSGKFLLTVSGRLSDVRELMSHFHRLSGELYPKNCYRVCNQMTTVQNVPFVIPDNIQEKCEDAGFEFGGTRSTRLMIRYDSYELTVFETGLAMIFGIVEKDNSDITSLQTAIRALAESVGRTCIDSEHMMGALVEFGKQRETWDTRTPYKKKKEKSL